MSYEQLNILPSYKTNRNDIVKEFYLPVLKKSVLYKRAVGFFSSTALVELSKGLAELVKQKGKIKFIVSPLLSPEDIEAIQKGYDQRGIIESALFRQFEEPKNNSEEERLNWLATLIAVGALEIKVAFTPPSRRGGMYHEKIGIVYDEQGNKIAFTGSMNETINAFHNNYESIVVFNSLESKDFSRVEALERDFDSLWAGREDNITVLDFPKALRDKLLSFKKPTCDLTLDDKLEIEGEKYFIKPGEPCIPKGVDLHKYQKDAIQAWSEAGYRGIFDMATGTGKTYTGLGAAVRLFEEKNRAAILIVCPYQHLVEQWVEDIEAFNMRPIIGYSASKQKDWKKRLQNAVIDFKLGIINVFCFVTTNATYSSEYVQKELNKLGKDTFLLIDEAHNFGAEHLRTTLNLKFEYRLALSATLERHGDIEGTQALYDYFGDKCIEYGLKRAIDENKLTPYYYHPEIVYLTEDELAYYRDISHRISKACRFSKDGRLELTEQAKKLLIERARIVAGASNKVLLLKELMQQYKDQSHILIYCGATRTSDFKQDTSERDEEGERQIVAVSKMLGHELGMKVTHFTSAESAEEREDIKKRFAEVDPYQAIVAIKCLDEGVNIPSIKIAFILASSTNPKEYIQRRGRVLRKAANKPHAIIYDFITLPTPLDYVNAESDFAKMDRSLIRKELMRMQEFGEIAINSSKTDALIKTILEKYQISLETEEEIDYE